MIGATKYTTRETSVTHSCQVPLIFIEDSSILPMHCSDHFVQCSMQFLRRCSMHFYAKQQISAWISAMACGRLLCLLSAFRATDLQEANYHSTLLTMMMTFSTCRDPCIQAVRQSVQSIFQFCDTCSEMSSTLFVGVLAPQHVISNHNADEMANI